MCCLADAACQARSLPHCSFSVADPQEQTALVETNGSKLLETCKSLLEGNRFAEVVEELVPHLNLMFEKAKRTGDCTEQASPSFWIGQAAVDSLATLPKSDHCQALVP